MSWSLPTELSTVAKHRCETHMDAVRLASGGDEQVVQPVLNALNEGLEAAGATGISEVEAVLATLPPPEHYGVVPVSPQERAEASMAGLGVVLVLLGIVLSVVLGRVYDGETGWMIWLATMLGGLVMGVQTRGHRMGRVTFGLAVLMAMLTVVGEVL